jgi:Domain of unknown function (DUF4156)
MSFRTLTSSLLLVLALIAGCAPVTLTRRGERVRLVRTPSAVRQCELLGEVESASGWGGRAGARGLENNQRMLRNETARRGGDTLLIIEERASIVAPYTYGNAYRCGPAPQP